MVKICRNALILIILGIFIYSNPSVWPVFAAPQTFGISVSATISPTTLIFQGYTAPHSLIYVTENNTVVGTGTSQSSGNFNITLVAVSPGIQNYQIYSQDTNGINSNVVSISDNIMPDRTNNIYNINLSPTFATSTNGNTLSLRGMAYPLSKIEIFLDSSYEYSTSVESNGNFKYSEDASSISLGKYIVTVLDITNNGVISNYSNGVMIDITNVTSKNHTINHSPTPTTNTYGVHAVHIVKNSNLNYCSFNYCNRGIITAVISKHTNNKSNMFPTVAISLFLLILIVIILRRLF